MYKNLKNLQTNTSDLKTADKLIEMHSHAGDFLKVEPIYKELRPETAKNTQRNTRKN